MGQSINLNKLERCEKCRKAFGVPVFVKGEGQTYLQQYKNTKMCTICAKK